MFALVRSDIEALRNRVGRVTPFVFPQLTASTLYRGSSAVRRRGFPRLAAAVAALGQALTGAEISPQAQLGPGLVVMHTGGLVIGRGVRAGARLTLFSGVTLGSTLYDSRSRRPSGFPTLGTDVTCYTKCSVLGPIAVGDRAILGAHALVLDEVPADHTAKGIPARSTPNGVA